MDIGKHTVYTFFVSNKIRETPGTDLLRQNESQQVTGGKGPADPNWEGPIAESYMGP